jgi:GH43 family beta-xylosidase
MSAPITRRTVLAATISLAVVGGCAQPRVEDAGPDSAADAPGVEADASVDAARDAAEDTTEPADASPPRPPPAPCTTRITYGSAWIRPPGHPAQHDEVEGRVDWDGRCVADGPSSYAVLSNGWRPYFAGRSSCVIALDVSGDCAEPPAAECRTRITYGDSWLPPPDHPARYDEVAGAVTWNGECPPTSGGNSSGRLSNGWVPHFAGSSACAMSFRHTQCGGLYANPVIPLDCPDPGVLRDGDRYVLTCTGGIFGAIFPIRTSRDLVRWEDHGSVFPSGEGPSWATRDFWAPEIHRVGDRYIAYYSARGADGHLALGAATAGDPLGPYTDLGHPLLTDPRPGIIDAHHFEGPDGRHFLLWKLDGNDIGVRTPIYIQELADDGVTLRGSRTEILTNDHAWEGALVEGPWMIHEGGYYYLFYSGNAFYDARYASGVARSTSPVGPFEKLPWPILRSNGSFSGPGHGSVIRGPSGEWVHVYHAWRAGGEGGPMGRMVLVDRVRFTDGWPTMPAAPSGRSQPLP